MVGERDGATMNAGAILACPFFLPQQRRDDLLWPHPARLPLGGGFGGVCCAPGHEGTVPADDDLKDLCNLGYAKACPRLPKERSADAVRYVVSLDSEERVIISYCFEREHAPGEHGHAEFHCASRRFTVRHPDATVQKQLECYLDQYWLRRPSPRAPHAEQDERH